MKKNYAFILLFFLLNVFVFIVIKYNLLQSHIDQVSNGFYSNNSVKIIDKDIKKYISAKDKDIRIFLEYDENYRFILKNDDWKPNIISGDFFTFNNDSNIAVLGRDFEKYIEIKDEKKYINFLGLDYEVIGIIGEKFDSKADTLVFLNTEKLPNVDIQYKIVIDGKNSKIVKKYIDNLEKKYGPLNIIKKENINLSKNIDTNFFYILINMVSILLTLTTIYVFIRYYFEKSIKLFQVQNLLGLKNNTINKYFIKDISTNIIIANFLSIGIAFILELPINILIYFLIISFIYSIIISSIFVSNWTRTKYEGKCY